jgi:H+/Cl- antiporter ClcA
MILIRWRFLFAGVINSLTGKLFIRCCFLFVDAIKSMTLSIRWRFLFADAFYPLRLSIR